MVAIIVNGNDHYSLGCNQSVSLYVPLLGVLNESLETVIPTMAQKVIAYLVKEPLSIRDEISPG